MPAARWYGVENARRTEDIPFYLAAAERWAGPGGAVLEIAAGEGRVSLPLARAGFRVTAADSSPAMRERLAARLAREPEEVRRRVEIVAADVRKLALDRLWRFVCLPFNSLLLLNQPHERQRALERIREHLAPSGALAFDVFTPDPRRLVDQPDFEVELDHEAEDEEAGTVRVTRLHRRGIDLGRQLLRVDWRHRVSRDGVTLAEWEDGLDLALIFPGELALLLERQGFRLEARHGGPDGRPYAPTLEDVQPMYVIAKIAP
ncbi:MAG TPA: class I SAM-dependent methyltransferase [Candidatus Dormibacteraeota bacterium]|nr:class I SAM-dependent methyltransferase [Candidatus Dormibacteraeota bacterium]